MAFARPASTRKTGTASPCGGFSLIEMLTVIAVIAILAAIIFPVYSIVREGVRQKTVMSNMYEVSTGMAKYQLDHGHYPPVLFGYYYPGSSMRDGLSKAQAAGQAGLYFPGLYPEFIANKDFAVFQDPNNPVVDLSKDTGPIGAALLAPCDAGQDTALAGSSGCAAAVPGALVPTHRDFYAADALDTSPQIVGTNKVAPNYVLRYETSWTGAPPLPGDLNARRQLRQHNPPGDTYVTSSTYHVPNANKVIILWQDGSTKALDASRFLAPGADVADVSSGSARFWTVSPSR